MSDYHSPWDCPYVKDALKEDRPPSDIMIACCQKCHCYSYYGQGSHFSCSWCEWTAWDEDLDMMMDVGEIISLTDYEDVDEGDVP